MKQIFHKLIACGFLLAFLSLQPGKIFIKFLNVSRNIQFCFKTKNFFELILQLNIILHFKYSRFFFLSKKIWKKFEELATHL